MKSFLLLSSLVGTSLSAAVPREAAPEPAPQVLGSPSRTVIIAPTPPWWHWRPTATATPPRITSFPRDAAPEPEPQVLGSPSRTVIVAPTPPWWWHGGWPAATPVDSVPRNAAPEPQVLGSPSRTAQQLPTPPLPWWWNQWPAASAVNEREVEEKREPQTLDYGTRTVDQSPHTITGFPGWSLPHGPDHTRPYEIDSTITLPLLTLGKEKREPQTLVFSPSRTNIVLPTPPTTHHHHPTTISTIYIPVSTNPYEIDATLTLPHLTLDKRDPQSISIIFPITRTEEITPTGPSTTHHHYSPTSTVYVTVTEDGPSSIHHHHTRTSTKTIYFTDPYPIYTPSPTGTEIDATLTLPYITTPTFIDDSKRAAEPENQEVAHPTTIAAPTSTQISPIKENPCDNNIFAPPAWCFGPTVTVTITVTKTSVPTATSLFQTTNTLPPLTLTIGSPPWGRKDKRSRQRV